MRIDEVFATREEPVFSFEFFPPKTAEGERALHAALEELTTLRPEFVSVTWGAGGSTRTATIDIVRAVRERFGVEGMAHFTCVGATVDELHASLREMGEAGIENVLALRGDPPRGEDRFRATRGGLSHASDLARLVTEGYPFCVVGACYPETHQEATGPAADLEALHRKVESGVSVLITQLFFDNADYFRFVERVRGAGIEVPIVPGVIPITSAELVTRISGLCGARIPDGLARELAARADRPQAVTDLGIAYATHQCVELLAGGAPGIHFYTLNRAPATSAVVSALRLTRPWESAPMAARAAAHGADPSG